MFQELLVWDEVEIFCWLSSLTCYHTITAARHQIGIILLFSRQKVARIGVLVIERGKVICHLLLVRERVVGSGVVVLSSITTISCCSTVVFLLQPRRSNRLHMSILVAYLRRRFDFRVILLLTPASSFLFGRWIFLDLWWWAVITALVGC